MPKPENKYLIETLSKLVSFDTNSSEKTNYVKCASYISSELTKSGLKSKIITFRGLDKKPRPNVLATLNTGSKETVLLLMHFDVVPAGGDWKTDPFKLTKKGNNFYGRGAADDKSAIAASFAAIKELLFQKKKFKKNLKVLVVCDEEVGGKEGIALLTKKKKSLFKADFCATLDGELDCISVACSGIIHGTITLNGKGGHAGYDFETENILHKSIPFLSELAKYKKVRGKKHSFMQAAQNPVSKKMFGRFNITILNAGSQFNVIPSQLKIGFDMRLLPEENPGKISKEFRKFVLKISKKFQFNPKIDLSQTPGYYVSNNKYTKFVKLCAEKSMGKKLKSVCLFGGTDARFVNKIGIPSYTFTPGGSNTHSNKESISLRELIVTKNFVKNLLIL